MYRVLGTSCPQVYIGQTGCTLEHHLNKHESTNFRHSYLLYNCWACTQHQPQHDWANTSVVDSHPHFHSRCALEAWHNTSQRQSHPWTESKNSHSPFSIVTIPICPSWLTTRWPNLSYGIELTKFKQCLCCNHIVHAYYNADRSVKSYGNIAISESIACGKMTKIGTHELVFKFYQCLQKGILNVEILIITYTFLCLGQTGDWFTE